MEFEVVTGPSDHFAHQSVLNTRKCVVNHPLVECDTTTACCSVRNMYYFNQTVMVMRHADRLDTTPGWHEYEPRHTWPNDTPLSAPGVVHARENAKTIARSSPKFHLVLSSPFLRCAETACEISRELNIPVHFDRDLGEVCNFLVRTNDGPQHRSPEELSRELESRFPDVKLRRDEHGQVIIRGVDQRHPESLLHARLRFCFKLQQVVQAATEKLNNVLVVTHADALAAIVSFWKPSWVLTHVPYAAIVKGQRRVVVASSNKEQKDFSGVPIGPVFGRTQTWSVETSDGITLQKKPTVVQRREQELWRMTHHRSFLRMDRVNSIFKGSTEGASSADVSSGSGTSPDSSQCATSISVSTHVSQESQKEATLMALQAMDFSESERNMLMSGAMDCDPFSDSLDHLAKGHGQILDASSSLPFVREESLEIFGLAPAI